MSGIIFREVLCGTVNIFYQGIHDFFKIYLQPGVNAMSHVGK